MAVFIFFACLIIALLIYAFPSSNPKAVRIAEMMIFACFIGFMVALAIPVVAKILHS